MAETSPQPRRYFTEAAREAARSARAAKREEPDDFGTPEVFVVKAGDRTFTWEIRRFGGLLIQRGAEFFASQGPSASRWGTGPGRLVCRP